ncbi:MAG: SH3 domain-containing C40 family peptidase [Oscillospiraceae bacterium]
MSKKLFKTIAITATLCAILSVSAFAASSGGARVSASSLNLRAAPNASAALLETAPQNSAVVVSQRIDNEWTRVVYEGSLGYMSSEFLSFSETLEAALGSGSIKGSDVRLRSIPSLAGPIIGTLQNGTAMQVIGVSGPWYKVQGSGAIGYVHSDFFALTGKSGAQATDKGQQIVDTAMKYMGVPYVWGGTSASGFDCSGFVYYVYKECGYTINRTAASIYSNGVSVDKANLQVGDAICFSSSRNSIGHVGIYVGDGKFIHSSSGSGSVIISELSMDYYENHYVGSRRIV